MNHRYSILFLLALAFAAAILLVRRFLRARAASVGLPPSPTSYPLVGNLFSLPLTHEHLAYTELSKKLGSDVISLNFFGTTIVVLHSAQAAIDLFDKRSAIYSDRTSLTMVNDKRLIDWSNFVIFERYGDRFRAHRRMLNTWLNRSASRSFHQIQEHQTRLLLQRLLESCDGFASSDQIHDELYRTTAATILHSTYGYRVESLKDPFVVAIKELTAALGRAIVPSNFLVNVVPQLVHVPEWFPGAKWKRLAREWREKKEIIVPKLYQWTKDQVANGTAEPSIIRSMLNYHASIGRNDPETEQNMQQEGIVLFAAGADTTAGALQVFILAMVLFPEVQAKAQRELDLVVGNDRLPNLSDQSQLPYIQNLILEVLRWQPITPVGVPHACFQDDVYRGYRIPKGTTLIGNIWAISRDENVYPDPENFNPDRFLDRSVPPAPAFGWGRRKYPGSYYVEDLLFVCIASILATFNLSKAKDASGQDIVPGTEGAAKTALYHPKPFPCVLAPRSVMHRELVASCV